MAVGRSSLWSPMQAHIIELLGIPDASITSSFNYNLIRSSRLKCYNSVMIIIIMTWWMMCTVSLEQLVCIGGGNWLLSNFCINDSKLLSSKIMIILFKLCLPSQSSFSYCHVYFLLTLLSWKSNIFLNVSIEEYSFF